MLNAEHQPSTLRQGGVDPAQHGADVNGVTTHDGRIKASLRNKFPEFHGEVGAGVRGRIV